MAHRDPWDDGGHAWVDLVSWSRSGGDALAALSDIGQLRRLLDEAELEAVRAARRQGKSWAEIAIKLGVTRQSAWERWRDLDPEPAAPASAEVSLKDAVLDEAARTARRRGQVLVPLVIGLPVDEARAALAERGLIAVAADADGPSIPVLAARGAVVADQSPESGARTAPESMVKLWIERGGGAGVREPRRPKPVAQAGRKMRDEPSEDLR